VGIETSTRQASFRLAGLFAGLRHGAIWLIDGRWVPTSPNASYLFFYEDSLLPIMESGRAQLVASDYDFDDSVSIEPWPCRGVDLRSACRVMRVTSAK
jgi:hypothetical protein